MNSPVSTSDRQQDVHERTRERDDHPLPAGFARKPRGSLAVLVARLLSGHLHVAAEQDRRKAEIRLAARKPNRRGPNPKLNVSTRTSKSRAAQ